MISQPNVDKLIRQTQQYEFADGLRDLQMAIILGTLGIVSWLTFDLVYAPFLVKLIKALGPWIGWLSILLVIVLPVIVTWGVLGLMNYVRRRWLWRESGMVKSLSWLVPRWVTVLATTIYLVSVVLSLGLHFSGRFDALFALHMLVVAAGWSTGVTLVGFGLTIGLPRYMWLGVLGGLISTLLLFLRLSFGQTALVFGLSWGFLFAASGIVLLRRTLLSLREVGGGG